MRTRVEGDCHRRQFPGQSDARGTDSYDGEVSSVYDSGLRDPNPSNGHRCRRRRYHPGNDRPRNPHRPSRPRPGIRVYTRKSMPREIHVSRRGGNVTVQPNTAQWNTLPEFTGQRFHNDTSRWYRSVGSTLQTRMPNAKYGQDTKIHMYTNG